MRFWILVAALAFVASPSRAERLLPPHRCGEDQLLARLKKSGGDMVDKLLKTQPRGECVDGPENPIEVLIAEVVCASAPKLLAKRLTKVESRAGISKAVVQKCGSRPEVARWAVRQAAAALHAPARRDLGLDLAYPIAESGEGAPLLNPLLDALDDELAHRGAPQRIASILGVVHELAPDIASSPHLVASLEAVLVASDGDLAHLDVAAQSVRAMAATHSASPKAKEHILALVKRLEAGTSRYFDLSSARTLIASALHLDRAMNASVVELLVSAASASPRACATSFLLTTLALAPEQTLTRPAIVGCIRSTLRDPDEPVYVRHDAGALVRLALLQDLHGMPPPFGLEDLVLVHAVETHEKLDEELPRPLSTLDRLNRCRLEAGLPSLAAAEVGEPSTSLRDAADLAAGCMEVRVCAPGRAAYAAAIKACCPATPAGSAPRSWCASP